MFALTILTSVGFSLFASVTQPIKCQCCCSHVPVVAGSLSVKDGAEWFPHSSCSSFSCTLSIYVLTGSTYDIIGTTFTKNSAVRGGAIYVGEAAHVTITDTNFTNNTATEAGGAIFADENSVVNIIAQNSDVLFKGNKVGKI